MSFFNTKVPHMQFGSRVMPVTGPYTDVKSYMDAAPHMASKPVSTFEPQSSDSWTKWSTPLPKEEVQVSQTLGGLADLYGIEMQNTFWSPNCQDFACSARATRAGMNPSASGSF